MTESKVAAAGLALFLEPGELEGLLGARAKAYREELDRLLRQSADGHNVDAALLELLYGLAETRDWLASWLNSPKSQRASQSRRRSPDFSATADEPKDPVQFSAYTPSSISLEAWSDLLAYIHVPDAAKAVQADSQRQLPNRPHGVTLANASNSIQRGAEIQVSLSIPDCLVNPPRASVLWSEDWHRLGFRVRVADDTPRQQLGTSRIGNLRFHVGPLLVGELPIITTLTGEAAAEPPPLRETPPVRAYRKIFCSYSHKDAVIAERLEAAYTALGDDYWRDVRKLRSGQDWSAEIQEKIVEADIFQLFWSANAKASKEVEKEWRAAHQLRRPHFIRPVYWHKRIPKPPPELDGLHFSRLGAAS